MSNAHVLIIEGEPWMGEQFKRTLEKDGFTVSSTSNAYSAMEIVDEFTPDVIVMGLLLSGVGGLSLLHELQSYSDTATIPVIVCTAETRGFAAGELDAYGVVRVIDMSTMRPSDIPAAVRSVLA